MRVGSFSVFAPTVALAIVASPAGHGQATPNGAQFQVNSYTTGDQGLPVVAVDPQGRSTVVWMSFAEGDDPGWGLRGQRYAASGTPLGPAFQVNSTTTLHQERPRIASAPDGEFVVVWESSVSPGSDSAGRSILARRFGADGAPLGSDFQVNSYTTGNQRLPGVATDGTGDFVVVWQSAGSTAGDTLGYSVQGQRFAADGLPQGDQFQINGDTTGNQQRAKVAADPAGNFWVVFETDAAATGDADGSVQARFYDAAGTAFGPAFTLNAATSGVQNFPAIAADAAGDFLAVWESATSSGTDSSSTSIQGYRLNAFGEAVGDEFQVNTYTTGFQSQPSVTAHGNGGFLATWDSQAGPAPALLREIRARQVGVGADFMVNTLTAGNQDLAAIATDRDGNFIVVWESDGSLGTDSHLFSVQAQRYDALFRDGFETNDTGRWSSAAP